MNHSDQFLRFVVVGVASTLTHIAVAIVLNEMLSLSALVANFLAFTTPVLVSYLGNHGWTFSRRGQHSRYLPRFVLVALTGMALNQLIVYGIVDLGGLSYRLALATVVLIVPMFSFALNQMWVFAASSAAVARGNQS